MPRDTFHLRSGAGAHGGKGAGAPLLGRRLRRGRGFRRNPLQTRRRLRPQRDTGEAQASSDRCRNRREPGLALSVPPGLLRLEPECGPRRALLPEVVVVPRAQATTERPSPVTPRVRGRGRWPDGGEESQSRHKKDDHDHHGHEERAYGSADAIARATYGPCRRQAETTAGYTRARERRSGRSPRHSTTERNAPRAHAEVGPTFETSRPRSGHASDSNA